MPVPYYAEYPYQIATWRHYLGIAIPNAKNPDLLYTWFSFDQDEQSNNDSWPLAQFSHSPTLKYDTFDSSLKNFSYNPTFEVLTTSIDYYNKWEEYNWSKGKVFNWEAYIITKVYFNNDLVLDYNQYVSQGHGGMPIFSFESKSYDTDPYKIDLENEDLEIVVYLGAEQWPYHELEYYKINNDRENYHYINFDDNLEQEILLPIGKTANKKRFETFTFTKLFPNDFNSPQQINDLIEIQYHDPVNNLTPLLIEDPQVTVSFNDGYNDEYQVNTTWTKINENDYILSVEDEFYYNEHKKTVYQGNSKKYDNESNIIIPWDYANNYGEINLKLQVETYDQQIFYLTLPIKNKNKLSGNQDGKYYFTYEEISNNDLDFDYIFTINVGRYIEYVNSKI